MKKSRQQKATRVMEIANKRMRLKLATAGIKVPFGKTGEDEAVIPHPRDTYVKMVGVDRLVRAWDLASIIL